MSGQGTPARADRHTVALLGNPNTGKSSLFQALTGTRVKIANYPGVTVEAKLGQTSFENTELTIMDLPGTYSLAARSPDERVATDALLGRVAEAHGLDGVILVVDASTLDRNLYLATQVLEFGLPTVIALTMADVAENRGIRVDAQALAKAIGAPVVPVHAPSGRGISELRATLHRALHHPATPMKLDYPAEFRDAVDEAFTLLCDLGVKLGFKPARPEALRLLVDTCGPLLEQVEQAGGADTISRLQALREKAGQGRSLSLLEAQTRYGAIAVWTQAARKVETTGPTRTDRLDAILTHKVWGTLVFALVMGLIFTTIYRWSEPLMGLIEDGFGALGGWAGSHMNEGPLRGLVVDGVIAGAGGVLVFLPQILILFLFIALLEDVGYMSRAAFLMDRLMARFGLSGRAFIPLLSSYACNVPAVMGARVIEDRSTRLSTMFLAPFMSCSARLPVYTLFIAAFVPARNLLGFIPLQGLVLFAMYSVGILFAIPTALLLKRTVLKGKGAPFLMELPSYKRPQLKSIARVLWDKGGSFVARAGTIILAVSVLVWAAGYFPRSEETLQRFDALAAEQEAAHVAALDKLAVEHKRSMPGTELADLPEIAPALADLAALDAAHQEALAAVEESDQPEAEQQAAEEAYAESLNELGRRHGNAFSLAVALHEQLSSHEEALADVENRRAGELLRESALGRMGQAIEPLVAPMGWDWRIGMAAIASFPAREVVVATLGTIFNVGAADEESTSLRTVLQQARNPDGTPVFTMATGFSVMVFFALCAQCAATLAVLRRETRGWRWPLASFAYMTGLAYVAATVTFQVARALGG